MCTQVQTPQYPSLDTPPHLASKAWTAVMAHHLPASNIIFSSKLCHISTPKSLLPKSLPFMYFLNVLFQTSAISLHQFLVKPLLWAPVPSSYPLYPTLQPHRQLQSAWVNLSKAEGCTFPLAYAFQVHVGLLPANLPAVLVALVNVTQT